MIHVRNQRVSLLAKTWFHLRKLNLVFLNLLNGLFLNNHSLGWSKKIKDCQKIKKIKKIKRYRSDTSMKVSIYVATTQWNNHPLHPNAAIHYVETERDDFAFQYTQSFRLIPRHLLVEELTRAVVSLTKLQYSDIDLVIYHGNDSGNTGLFVNLGRFINAIPLLCKHELHDRLNGRIDREFRKKPAIIPLVDTLKSSFIDLLHTKKFTYASVNVPKDELNEQFKLLKSDCSGLAFAHVGIPEFRGKIKRDGISVANTIYQKAIDNGYDIDYIQSNWTNLILEFEHE